MWHMNQIECQHFNPNALAHTDSCDRKHKTVFQKMRLSVDRFDLSPHAIAIVFRFCENSVKILSIICCHPCPHSPMNDRSSIAHISIQAQCTSSRTLGTWWKIKLKKLNGNITTSTSASYREAVNASIEFSTFELARPLFYWSVGKTVRHWHFSIQNRFSITPI